MIEYIFFDAALRDKFLKYAEDHAVPCSAVDDNMGMVVEVSEDIPDDLSDKLEEFYEALEDEQASLSRAEGDLNRLAGFGFKLPNGEARMVPVSPDMANRLMLHFTLEEIQELFNSVAHFALEPPNDHLCKILAAQQKKKG
ncbi:MAG: hypothetical protein KJ795_06635 [Gammaproteobacteria bacterium]|nr:hypothetical protein [Gammaproteobacteria bacterium]MBU1775401.1 hypothetical protein [Gammaproteobacteria bacterium]MBU1969658.1 hypothetical protein [Gammaproteobacteria bacterium]